MSAVDGKIALVTGGANGIGLSYVRGLLKHGAKGVTIADVDQSKGQKAAHALTKEFGIGRVIFLRTDVTSEFELEEAFKKTVNNFQQLDIVINNAGIVNEIHWEKTISVNLIGVIRGTILAREKYLPKYHTGDQGTVVNTSSITGFKPFHSLPVYSSTKHAIIGIGRSFGSPKHFEKYKVRVLTLCPGLTLSEMANIGDKDYLLGNYKDLYPDDNTPLPRQPVEFMEEAIVELLEKGTNGSVWVAEDSNLNEVIIPDYKTLYKN